MSRRPSARVIAGLDEIGRGGPDPMEPDKQVEPAPRNPLWKPAVITFALAFGALVVERSGDDPLTSVLGILSVLCALGAAAFAVFSHPSHKEAAAHAAGRLKEARSAAEGAAIGGIGLVRRHW